MVLRVAVCSWGFLGFGKVGLLPGSPCQWSQDGGAVDCVAVMSSRKVSRTLYQNAIADSLQGSLLSLESLLFSNQYSVPTAYYFKVTSKIDATSDRRMRQAGAGGNLSSTQLLLTI